MVSGGFAGAKDTFDVRYYRWAMADANRELRQGLPWVSRIRGGFALKVVELMADLSEAERGQVMTALVKRVHENALRLTGESITPEERAIIHLYVESGRARETERYWQLRLADPRRVRVNRRRLLTRVTAALSPVLDNEGERFGSSSSQEWLWITPVGPWVLRTTVDVGGDIHQLQYRHILRAATDRRYLSEHISFLVWLGIGQTIWDCLLEPDTGEAVEVLAQLCAHFTRALPDLVAGLSPEGPAEH